jgi:hypothetical protein
MVIKEHDPNLKDKRPHALAAKYNIPLPNVKRWIKDRVAILQSVGKDESCTKKRRLGGGRPGFFPELEQELTEWISECNKNGLIVKEKYIVNESLNIAARLADLNPLYEDFKGSKGWLAGFKARHALVSRRHTSTRCLPPDARATSLKFMSDVQTLIEEKNILPKNILNADQVPRFYENQGSATIVPKGTRNVFLRKASSSHKKLTATFLINSEGKLEHTHVLLSKLQKVPADIKMRSTLRVQVNSTGMWSCAILDDYMMNVILKRPESSLLKQPVLLIIDSFSPHVLVANSKKFEKYNVFIIIVPPNLTNLLQPLDVVVNKSFQSNYNEQYDRYIRDASATQENRTKAGNIKIPTHKMTIDWIQNWATSVNCEMVKKAFIVCGIVRAEHYKVENLHAPLQELVSDEFDEFMWNHNHSSLICADENFEFNEDNYFNPNHAATSFLEGIHMLKERHLEEKSDFYDWLPQYILDIKRLIAAKWNIVLDEADDTLLKAGNLLGTNLDIHAVAIMEDIEIKIVEIDSECKLIGTTILNRMEDESKIVEFLQVGEYFLVKV